MKSEKINFKNAKGVLSRDEMKQIKGGIETWDCTCAGGTIGFNGFGNAGDFRDDVIAAGCANSPTYCHFAQVQ